LCFRIPEMRSALVHLRYKQVCENLMYEIMLDDIISMASLGIFGHY